MRRPAHTGEAVAIYHVLYWGVVNRNKKSALFATGFRQFLFTVRSTMATRERLSARTASQPRGATAQLVSTVLNRMLRVRAEPGQTACKHQQPQGTDPRLVRTVVNGTPARSG